MNNVSGLFQLMDSWGNAHISGSYYPADVAYALPVVDDDIIVNSVEVLICEHCGQAHRVDYAKLQAIAVLGCKKCGASLI